MYLGSLESTQEARVALGYASNNSYASLVLSKLPACIHIQRLLEHFDNIRKTKMIHILSFRSCSFNFLGLENSNSSRRLYIKKTNKCDSKRVCVEERTMLIPVSGLSNPPERRSVSTMGRAIQNFN